MSAIALVCEDKYRSLRRDRGVDVALDAMLWDIGSSGHIIMHECGPEKWSWRKLSTVQQQWRGYVYDVCQGSTDTRWPLLAFGRTQQDVKEQLFQAMLRPASGKNGAHRPGDRLFVVSGCNRRLCVNSWREVAVVR